MLSRRLACLTSLFLYGSSQLRAFRPDLKSHMADWRFDSMISLPEEVQQEGSREARRWEADRTAGRSRSRERTLLTWKSMAERGTSASLNDPTEAAEDNRGGGMIEPKRPLRRSNQGEEICAGWTSGYFIPLGMVSGKCCPEPSWDLVQIVCWNRSPLCDGRNWSKGTYQAYLWMFSHTRVMQIHGAFPRPLPFLQKTLAV